MTISRTGNSVEVFKYHPSGFPRDQLGEYFQHLPGEVLVQVFSKMSGWELAQKIAVLNKAFCQTVQDNYLWKERTISKFTEFGKSISLKAPFDSSRTDAGYWRGKYIKLCNERVFLIITGERLYMQNPQIWHRLATPLISASHMIEDQDYLMILIERVKAAYMKVWEEEKLKTDMDFQRRVMEVHGMSKVSWSALPKLLFSQLVFRIDSVIPLVEEVCEVFPDGI